MVYLITLASMEQGYSQRAEEEQLGNSGEQRVKESTFRP